MPTRFHIAGYPIPESFFQRRRILPVVGLFITILVFLEWTWDLDFSLGILYVFPIILGGTVLNRWQIVLTALFCAYVRGLFAPVNSILEIWLRFAMASLAYSGIGLLVVEMVSNRRRVLAHYAQLQFEQGLRRRVEEQLRILAESSPAAIVTLDNEGNVLAANKAAHEMFGEEEYGSLIGRSLAENVPMFANALKLSPGARPVRASASTWAHRLDGTSFPVATWFSTYGEGENRCLAGILVDTSEEVRDRERENFRHFLDYNRLLAGAVSHEIRNLCSAISVVCSNLNRQVNLNDNADFQALNSLVAGLSRLASFDLRNRAGVQTSVVDIKPVLDEFRVIVEPDWLDIEGSVAVTLPDWFPKVHCDPHGLLQVFLNLAQNALRSAGSVPAPSGRSLEVRGSMRNNQAIISFVDAGPGIQDPDKLFKPFHPGAEGSGLGLYVSRTILRSFGGDLVFVPTEAGCRFEVVLIPSAPPRRPTEVNSGSSNEADPVVHPG